MSKKSTPNAYADAPYRVGKGKPPQHSRFKPGQSGNPSGRKRKPSGRDAIRSGIREALEELVTIRTATGERQVPAIVAAVYKVRNTVLQTGSSAQLQKLFAICDQFEVLTPEERAHVGVLVVPGRSATAEEWERVYGEPLRRSHEEMDRQLKEALPQPDPEAAKPEPQAPQKRQRLPAVTRPPSLLADFPKLNTQGKAEHKPGLE